MASDAPVVVIVAPPGFGKTTLLVQWQGSEERPFAWLSLDDGDNDPVVFLTGLVASIARVVPDFASTVVSALSSMGALAVDAVVARILNELDALDLRIVVALDDYHRITGRECHEILALLLERQPSTVQLIISTRADPPLPLARWRANGRLTELRAADLSFTGAEAAEVLTGTWGLDLASESIAVLHERTEGWPAGLYLACLSLRGTTDTAAFVADFGGATRMIIDYLMEVVLEQQSEELRDFLLETSVLEGLCGSLCDAVTGRTDSASVLIQLAHDNLFLVALDERHEWFRYHHLFGQALNEELGRRHSGRRPELHRRAGAWFAARGDINRAIHHAFAGGDLGTAATLVATHWITALNVGRLATLRVWLEAFPRPVMEADARLLLVTAWVSGLEGDAEAGLRAVSAARKVGYPGELPDGSGTVEESAALARSAFPWSDVGGMLSAARSAHARECERESPWQAVAALNLGWALIFAGESEQAREPLKQTVTLASASDQWVAAADARALLAETSVAAGDLEQAEAWIRDAIELATTGGFADLPHVGFYHLMAGTIHAGRGAYEEANRLMGIGLTQMRGSWEPLHLAQALLSLAPVRHALGAPAEARQMIAEARALIDACHDPGILQERLRQASRALVPAYRRAEAGSGLTERELEVLRLLAAGATEREAGATLFVSYSTIHSHTKSIYFKLASTSRDHAVARARELGLIT